MIVGSPNETKDRSPIIFGEGSNCTGVFSGMTDDGNLVYGMHVSDHFKEVIAPSIFRAVKAKAPEDFDRNTIFLSLMTDFVCNAIKSFLKASGMNVDELCELYKKGEEELKEVKEKIKKDGEIPGNVTTISSDEIGNSFKGNCLDVDCFMKDVSSIISKDEKADD